MYVSTCPCCRLTLDVVLIVVLAAAHFPFQVYEVGSSRVRQPLVLFSKSNCHLSSVIVFCIREATFYSNKLTVPDIRDGSVGV